MPIQRYMSMRTLRFFGTRTTELPSSTSILTIRNIGLPVRPVTMPAPSRRFRTMISWREIPWIIFSQSILFWKPRRFRTRKWWQWCCLRNRCIARALSVLAPMWWLPQRMTTILCSRMSEDTWCWSSMVKEYPFLPSNWKATTAN